MSTQGDTIIDTGKAQEQYGLLRTYTYINGEACMVLVPKIKRLGCTGFAIRVDDAWRWRTDNEDHAMVAHAAVRGAQMMRLDIDKTTIFQLITVIQDGLDDLLKMPPAPRAKREVIGEIEFFANGRRYSKELTA